MALISILIPTRENTFKLKAVLDNIYDMTADRDNIEVLLAIDNDDEESLGFQYNKLHIRRFIGKRQEGLGNYINIMAKSMSGDVGWTLSDDIKLETQDWDILVRDKLKQLDYDIWWGATYNYHIGKQGQHLCETHPAKDMSGSKINVQGYFACYPFFPRKLVDVLGYVYPSWIRCWGSDSYMDNVFRCLKRIVFFNVKLRYALATEFSAKWDRVWREDVAGVIEENVGNMMGITNIKPELGILREYIKEQEEL